MKNKECLAIVDSYNKLTYEELNNIANFYSQKLTLMDYEDKRFVGIIIDRSVYSILGILSILKSGSAYVPINVNQSKERVNKIISDCNIKVLVTSKENKGKFEYSGCEQLTLDLAEDHIIDSSKSIISIMEQDLAYAIFTSGTTGTPKGIGVMHKNVLNLVKGLKKEVYDKYNYKLNVALIADLAFDASVQQIFSSLLLGQTLYIVEDHVKADGNKLSQFFNNNKIDITDGTPTHLKLLIGDEEDRELNLKHMIIGGEPLLWLTIERFFNKFMCDNTIITNVYGPTECCVDNTFFHITRDIDFSNIKKKIVPIGKPLINQKIFILNENKRLQPIGIQGELFISGENVSTGYINNEELNNQRFIYINELSEKVLYKTGDIGYWTSDGNIEFIGRSDNQIKLKGYRIELGEIEHVLLSHEKIMEAIVTLRDDGELKEPYICAYYVSCEELKLDILQRYILEFLPNYMLPSFFIRVDKVPINKSGKIDRKALPKPIYHNINKESLVPNTFEEKILVEIWKNIFDNRTISRQDNFFSLGGDSIKIFQILSKLLNYRYKAEINDFYKYPTIEGMATRLKLVQKQKIEIEYNKDFELTPIQKRFFEQNKANENHFNQSIMLKLKQRNDINIIKKCLEELIEHHDSLRLRFILGDRNKIRQRYLDPSECNIDIKHFKIEDECNIDLTIQSICESEQRIFDFEKGLLINVVLFTTKEGQYLLLVAHHLIIDSVSWTILLGDLRILISNHLENKQEQISVKTNPYSEWVENIKTYVTSKEFKKDLLYWKNISGIDLLTPQYDGSDLAGKDKTLIIEMSKEKTELLKTKVNDPYGTNIQDVLITALGISLKDNFKMNNSLISLEGHGRQELAKGFDFSNTIGWFTSIYPYCLSLKKNHSIGEQLIGVKDDLRRINKQGISYGINEYFRQENGTKESLANLDSQISFNYLGELGGDLDNKHFELSNKLIGNMQSSNAEDEFLINVAAYIKDNKMSISVKFSKDKFNEFKIQEFIGSIESNINAIINHCINIKEKQQTSSDFDYQDLSVDDLNELFQ